MIFGMSILKIFEKKAKFFILAVHLILQKRLLLHHMTLLIFSSIGSARKKVNTAVAPAWIRSIGSPEA